MVQKTAMSAEIKKNKSKIRGVNSCCTGAGVTDSGNSLLGDAIVSVTSSWNFTFFASLSFPPVSSWISFPGSFSLEWKKICD